MKRERLALIEAIKLQGLPAECLEREKPLPLVSLEEFFIGNDAYGSIGCNLCDEHPGPQGFYEQLLRIRERPEVQDVLVEIHEVEEKDETMWPFSDRVYIVTKATKEEVAKWMLPLHPDEIEEGFAFGLPANWPTLRPNMNVFGAWWD